jgi:ApbE superfamily uncharacterized protein (UPF0280 family)
MYEPRTYRKWIKDVNLISFTVIVKETDLHIRAQSNLEKEALQSLRNHRRPLENYIKNHPLFLDSLEPYPVEDDAPNIVQEMAKAASIANVGPMAAVAGAIAEAVGRDLLNYSDEIIVENGGDIFLKSMEKRNIGIFAGTSPFTGKIALEIEPGDTPLGICASSGTVGHSLSFGVADAVVALSPSTALADAAATAIGNQITCADDIDTAIEISGHKYGLTGLVIIKDDRIGLWGTVKLVSE